MKVRRFLHTLLVKKPLGFFGAVIVFVMLLVAIFADLLAPFGLNETSLLETLKAPSAEHWFGTDELGRDVYSRVIYGARISMYVGLATIAISMTLASLIGIVSGYYGGLFDLLMQRVVDAWMSIPGLVAVIVIMALLGPGMFNVILALGLSQTFRESRVVRSAAIGIRDQPFIEAIIAAGAPHRRVVWLHVFPNVLPAIIIVASNALGFIILTEAAVSFLGYGIPAPIPSWGGMLSQSGRVSMTNAPWLSIFPGLALSLTVFGFNMLGDALRDLLDPRLRSD
jgi:peptide/nickel transport system permease protein